MHSSRWLTKKMKQKSSLEVPIRMCVLKFHFIFNFYNFILLYLYVFPLLTLQILCTYNIVSNLVFLWDF